MRDRGEAVSELAALLHSLKEQSGRTYTELARDCGASASTLHRYCRGQVLPDSYGMVERIALACGANKAELAHLFQLWTQADTDRLVPEAPAPPPVAVASSAPYPQAPASTPAVLH